MEKRMWRQKQTRTVCLGDPLAVIHPVHPVSKSRPKSSRAGGLVAKVQKAIDDARVNLYKRRCITAACCSERCFQRTANIC
jgi:hypothetical protein